MSEIRQEVLKSYLSKFYDCKVELLSVNGLGGEADPGKALTGAQQEYEPPTSPEVALDCKEPIK